MVEATIGWHFEIAMPSFLALSEYLKNADGAQ
jgi:hypothetical protein